jgi:all-trans-retinol 13,14-reductase
MSHHTHTYDTIIIGSGLGGLICANLLAMEGQQVCVLEKNEQIGGNLQTFKRNGVTFDTGVHYISGLDKGQNLHTIFNYLGIIDRLEIKKMDTEKFDSILFGNDENSYSYAMGYEQFIASLSSQFPSEILAIKKYCDDVKAMCSHFPMYHLQVGNGYKDESIFELSAFEYFEKLTKNETLKGGASRNKYFVRR